MSEDYTPDNLLDRHSHPATLDLHYGRLRERERLLLGRRIDLAAGGDVLAVGCGRDPGRHLFPAPAWRMTGVELEEEWPRMLVESGERAEGFAGRAGELDQLEDGSCDDVDDLTIATVDIAAGEEITCDYSRFDKRFAEHRFAVGWA